MASHGLRPVLQPVLYVGVAAILHGLLFLIPSGGPGKPDPGTTRGIRVKTYVEGPRAAAAPLPLASRTAAPQPDRSVRNATANRAVSMPGKDVSSGTAARGGESGDDGGPSGPPGPSQGPAVGSGGSPSEYGQYLARLRSEGVQGWARGSAKASRRGWKGSGTGTGGWGSGTGTGTGAGAGGGTGPGSGEGTYMDPRVRMVVVQYPVDGNGNVMVDDATNIERRFRPVPYPDIKFKKSQYTAGWWNVYIQVRTGKDGKVERIDVLRPETNGPLERLFVEQVRREVQRWDLEPQAEIHVDVRFYVE